MEHRGPYKYTESGMIDCEVNHPIYGWIPFSADENDSIGQSIFQEIVANEEVEAYISPEPPIPTLTYRQWFWMLNKYNLHQVLTDCLKAIDESLSTPEDREEYANLYDIVYNSQSYELNKILDLVDNYSEIIEQVVGSALDPELITAAFNDALTK